MLTFAENKRMMTTARQRANETGRRLGEMIVEEYNRLTGIEETNPNAIAHHIVELFPPPCRSCGKPLRTHEAKLCGSCMMPVEEKAQ